MTKPPIPSLDKALERWTTWQWRARLMMWTLAKTVTTCASSSVSGQRRMSQLMVPLSRFRQLIQQRSKSIVPVSLGCHKNLLSAIVEKTSSFYQLPSVLSVPTNNCTEDNQRHKQDVDGIYEVRRELQLAGFVASGWAPFGMPGAWSEGLWEELPDSGGMVSWCQLCTIFHCLPLLTCDITDITRETIWVLATEAVEPSFNGFWQCHPELGYFCSIILSAQICVLHSGLDTGFHCSSTWKRNVSPNIDNAKHGASAWNCDWSIQRATALPWGRLDFISPFP